MGDWARGWQAMFFFPDGKKNPPRECWGYDTSAARDFQKAILVCGAHLWRDTF
jgi:hypothetical protein